MEIEAVTNRQPGGQIGNQNAGKPNRMVSDMLRRLATQNPHKLRLACEGMLDKAATDVQAFNAIADRIEGKVITQVSVSTTHTVIDADLLSEAGKLLQIMSGQSLPVDVIEDVSVRVLTELEVDPDSE